MTSNASLRAVASARQAHRFFALLALLIPAVCWGQVAMTLQAADASAQPGKPITLAVRLEHADGWHTYWVNPGTGAPTSSQWTLPHGWTAGPIEWPTPIVITNLLGEVAGNGYEGTVYLPVELRVPADAALATASVKVHARWLMCAESCVPGQGDAAMDLAVKGTPPQPNTAVREALVRQPMPTPHADWKQVATRSGSSVTLEITGAPPMKAPHFFSEDGFIRSDQVQVVRADGASLSFSLSISDKSPPADTLRGVLGYTDERGIYRGAQIAVPISGSKP